MGCFGENRFICLPDIVEFEIASLRSGQKIIRVEGIEFYVTYCIPTFAVDTLHIIGVSSQVININKSIMATANEHVFVAWRPIHSVDGCLMFLDNEFLFMNWFLTL